MYEVVWLRMLSRITGVTIYATSTVLSAFMAGLALGSFLLGKFIDRRRDTLKVYALLEFLIGCTALIIPIILTISFSLYKYIYQTSGENIVLTTLIRAAVSFLVLLIPTTLMGGTLPVLTSYLVKRENLFGKSFSLLYGLNTLGAVLGVLLSGFITIGILGERTTVFIGVFINLLVAISAYSIYRSEKRTEGVSVSIVIPVDSDTADTVISPYSDPIRNFILFVFAMSGFTSLAYEVIWTRQLILFLKTSIYAFSGMLSVFLIGIALGSIFMNRIVDKLKKPLVIFGILELGIGFLSILNLYMFPHLYGGDFGSGGKFSGLFNAIFATVVIVFPITFLFGMIFPTAGLCYVKSVTRTGSSVGRLYSFNTVGTIFGALLAGFLFIPSLGSTNTVFLLAYLNVFLGAILLYLEPERYIAKKVACGSLVIIFVIMSTGLRGIDPFLTTIEKKMRQLSSEKGSGSKGYEIFFHKEGIEGTVTAFSVDKSKRLWVNGIGMTMLCTETKLMAHLPLLFTRESRECLVICFGMGTTVKSAALYPHLNITAVELVPEVFQIFKYYHGTAEEILKKENIHTVVADGRNYLLLSKRKYDLITIDPAPPVYSAGTVNLYTKDFFTLCREHLNPEGVMCLWVPGYTQQEIKSFLKTFHTVFPNMMVWSGMHGWGFYLIGTMEAISWSAFQQNIEKIFANPNIIKDLGEYDNSCVTPEQLYRLLLWDKDEIDNLSKDGVLITDNFPYTEFPLWRYLIKDRTRWIPQEVRSKILEVK
jgi:spermidine synthase